MRLLIQLSVLSTINLLIRGIVWLIRVLLPVLGLSLRILSVPVSMSFTATAKGPRQYVEQIAYEWSQALIDRGADPRNISRIVSLCRFLVASLLVLGWVFSVVFTLFILRVVFGFFI